LKREGEKKEKEREREREKEREREERERERERGKRKGVEPVWLISTESEQERGKGREERKFCPFLVSPSLHLSLIPSPFTAVYGRLK